MSNPFINYETAKSEQTELYHVWKQNCDELAEKFNHTRLSNGLQPDDVRSTKEYEEVKKKVDMSFKRLRDFNGNFNKIFKKEIKAENRQRTIERYKGV
jgi:hypothetical protein